MPCVRALELAAREPLASVLIQGTILRRSWLDLSQLLGAHAAVYHNRTSLRPQPLSVRAMLLAWSIIYCHLATFIVAGCLAMDCTGLLVRHRSGRTIREHPIRVCPCKCPAWRSSHKFKILQSVTDARYGQHVSRLLRVFVQLAAQRIRVAVNGARLDQGRDLEHLDVEFCA